MSSDRYGGRQWSHEDGELLLVQWQQDWRTKEWQLQLPHQCDSWVIGGVSEGRELLADLQRLLKEGPPHD